MRTRIYFIIIVHNRGTKSFDINCYTSWSKNLPQLNFVKKRYSSPQGTLNLAQFLNISKELLHCNHLPAPRRLCLMLYLMLPRPFLNESHAAEGEPVFEHKKSLLNPIPLQNSNQITVQWVSTHSDIYIHLESYFRLHFSNTVGICRKPRHFSKRISSDNRGWSFPTKFGRFL